MTGPPVAHVRKAQARVERLRELGAVVHPAISPDDPGRMPIKRVRRHYLEALELVLRDYDRILEQLSGNDGQPQ